jgi:hypothetical protein
LKQHSTAVSHVLQFFTIVAMQGFATNPNNTFRRHLQTQHLPHQGSLATAGASYQCEHFPAMHAKINIFVYYVVAETGMQSFHLNKALAVRH